jgi:hypothetical protein
MKIFRHIVLLLVIAPAWAVGQDTLRITEDNILYREIIDGDTFLLSHIEEVHIYSKPKFKTRREWRRYYRLIKNVKKVYPYAKLAAAEYDSLAQYMMTLPTEKERKQYIKEMESEIMSEYEDDLKKLTITQGRILLKLIDREIGETSYELLKELKGKFSAFFWQTLARIFGHNLKSEFDPEGEDKLLNEIMLMIEAGQL